MNYLWWVLLWNSDSFVNNDFLGFFQVKKERKVKSLSRVQLFRIPWTVAYQSPPFTGFSRQEYWNGLPLPSPGDFADPGVSHIIGKQFTVWATREVSFKSKFS